MIDFATGWLAELFGADVKKAIGKTSATRWNAEPLVPRRVLGRGARRRRAGAGC